MNSTDMKLTESEVRALRDRVFGIPITDPEWKVCGNHWMSREGISFLKAHDFPISESAARHMALKKSC